MCHAERQAVYDWLAEHGGTPDTPEILATRSRAAAAQLTRPYFTDRP